MVGKVSAKQTELEYNDSSNPCSLRTSQEYGIIMLTLPSASECDRLDLYPWNHHGHPEFGKILLPFK